MIFPTFDVELIGNISVTIICFRFIKELGHAEINQLKTSVSELKDGFSNLEISFKKVGSSFLFI